MTDRRAGFRSSKLSYVYLYSAFNKTDSIKAALQW